MRSEHTPGRRADARTAGHEGRRGGHVAERDGRDNCADHGNALVEALEAGDQTFFRKNKLREMSGKVVRGGEVELGIELC